MEDCSTRLNTSMSAYVPRSHEQWYHCERTKKGGMKEGGFNYLQGCCMFFPNGLKLQKAGLGKPGVATPHTPPPSTTLISKVVPTWCRKNRTESPSIPESPAATGSERII